MSPSDFQTCVLLYSFTCTHTYTGNGLFIANTNELQCCLGNNTGHFAVTEDQRRVADKKEVHLSLEIG